MPGRIKRKLEQQKHAAYDARAHTTALAHCALCLRPLGDRIEYHHRIPKSQGGTETIPLHPICHRVIHAHVSNHDLADAFADLEALRSRPDIDRFLRWVRNKLPNFHAPTRRKLEP